MLGLGLGLRLLLCLLGRLLRFFHFAGCAKQSQQGSTALRRCCRGWCVLKLRVRRLGLRNVNLGLFGLLLCLLLHLLLLHLLLRLLLPHLLLPHLLLPHLPLLLFLRLPLNSSSWQLAADGLTGRDSVRAGQHHWAGWGVDLPRLTGHDASRDDNIKVLVLLPLLLLLLLVLLLLLLLLLVLWVKLVLWGLWRHVA